MSEVINWDEVDEKIIVRISAEAETYLQGMMQAAVSTDQRSATLGGIFIAAATAISGAMLVYVTSESHSFPLFAGGLITALMFVVAAGLCLHATCPSSKPYPTPCSPVRYWADALEGDRSDEARQAPVTRSSHCTTP